jgi:HTH-type transcriptional regulator/antitoxin HigA
MESLDERHSGLSSTVEAPALNRIIQDEAEYDLMMAEFTSLIAKHEKRTPEETARVKELMPLIKEYEERNFSFDEPDAVDMILHRMEQMGLKRKDLVPMIGSRARVSEVLNRKRPLTIPMMVRLHHGLKMPYELLMPKLTDLDKEI